MTKENESRTERSPRVLLLVETSTSWGRGIVRGIARFIKEHEPWLLHLMPRGRFEALQVPADWQGEGIIARVTSEELAAEIIARGLPAVNVSWYACGAPQIPRVTADEAKCGQLMFAYFLARGFRSFAYCGISARYRPNYRDRIGEVFVDLAAQAGFACPRYPPPEAGAASGGPPELAAWLTGLTKPVAVATWYDPLGREITEACRWAGLAVPEQVAVLSADYDELFNALSVPPLTTVDQHPERVGYEASSLLDRWMRGQSPPDSVFIEPRGVITRQSTDIIAVADPLIAKVLAFVDLHFAEPIRAGKVCDEFRMPRHALEERFQAAVGRSITAEIRRVRLDKAEQMLVDTEEPVARVAKACGFLHVEVFIRNFSRQFGATPVEFRTQRWPG